MIMQNDIVTKENGREKIPWRTSLKGKGLVVEFVGPTGGGKTTNCRCFQSLLQQNGFAVYTFSDVKRYFYARPWYSKVWVISKIIFSRFAYLVGFGKVLASHRIFSFNSFYRYLKLSIFNEALDQIISNKKADVILLDQWIIQGLWSATIFKGREHIKLSQALRHFIFKSDVILYFDVDAITASQRINNRGNGKSRFDKMESSKRLIEFAKYNNYLNQLFEASDCKSKRRFSTMKTPEENARKFLEQLEIL